MLSTESIKSLIKKQTSEKDGQTKVKTALGGTKVFKPFATTGAEFAKLYSELGTAETFYVLQNSKSLRRFRLTHPSFRKTNEPFKSQDAELAKGVNNIIKVLDDKKAATYHYNMRCLYFLFKDALNEIPIQENEDIQALITGYTIDNILNWFGKLKTHTTRMLKALMTEGYLTIIDSETPKSVNLRNKFKSTVLQTATTKKPVKVNGNKPPPRLLTNVVEVGEIKEIKSSITTLVKTRTFVIVDSKYSDKVKTAINSFLNAEFNLEILPSLSYSVFRDDPNYADEVEDLNSGFREFLLMFSVAPSELDRFRSSFGPSMMLWCISKFNGLMSKILGKGVISKAVDLTDELSELLNKEEFKQPKAASSNPGGSKPVNNNSPKAAVDPYIALRSDVLKALNGDKVKNPTSGKYYVPTKDANTGETLLKVVNANKIFSDDLSPIFRYFEDLTKSRFTMVRNLQKELVNEGIDINNEDAKNYKLKSDTDKEATAGHGFFVDKTV
jgi:hypothetical protein